uniref:Putative cytochrome p-450 iic5 n=1 Tax=Ixodes ricinus TaxID=34613 RepID=A0A6B0UYV7_IXORI
MPQRFFYFHLLFVMTREVALPTICFSSRLPPLLPILPHLAICSSGAERAGFLHIWNAMIYFFFFFFSRQLIPFSPTTPTVMRSCRAAEDTYIDDYFVPQGSVVTSNVWAIHRDPKDWKNPDEFDPSRFLTPDGTQFVNKTDILIPFSIGKSKASHMYRSNMIISFVFLLSIRTKRLPW